MARSRALRPGFPWRFHRRKPPSIAPRQQLRPFQTRPPAAQRFEAAPTPRANHRGPSPDVQPRARPLLEADDALSRRRTAKAWRASRARCRFCLRREEPRPPPAPHESTPRRREHPDHLGSEPHDADHHDPRKDRHWAASPRPRPSKVRRRPAGQPSRQQHQTRQSAVRGNSFRHPAA